MEILLRRFQYGANQNHLDLLINFRVVLRGTDCCDWTPLDYQMDNVLFMVYGRDGDIFVYPLQSRCLL